MKLYIVQNQDSSSLDPLVLDKIPDIDKNNFEVISFSKENYKADFLDYIEDVLSVLTKNHKVVIFNSFDNSSELIQNKLLKTFETNLENTSILLIISNKNLVLNTILSRGYFIDSREGSFSVIDDDILKIFELSFTNDFIYTSLIPLPSGKKLEVQCKDVSRFKEVWKGLRSLMSDRLSYLNNNIIVNNKKLESIIKNSHIKASEASMFLVESLKFKDRKIHTLNYIWLKGILTKNGRFIS